MSKRKVDEVDRLECLDALRKDLPPGTPVYTVVRHVTRDGCTRDISLHFVTRQGDIATCVHRTATVLGEDVRNSGVRVRGVGMDMGYALVRRLSTVLHDDPDALTQRWL
jgi:hypothetical protein